MKRHTTREPDARCQSGAQPKTSQPKTQPGEDQPAEDRPGVTR
jgi:hypothetical protein